MSICDKCLCENCSYEPHSEECQSARSYCEFCETHDKEDILLEPNAYEYYTIKYCPICGRELDEPEDDEYDTEENN